MERLKNIQIAQLSNLGRVFRVYFNFTYTEGGCYSSRKKQTYLRIIFKVASRFAYSVSAADVNIRIVITSTALDISKSPRHRKHKSNSR